MRERVTPLALVLALIVGFGIYGADQFFERPGTVVTAEPAQLIEPAAGRWVCPVGESTEGAQSNVTLVAPPSAGGPPGRMELATFRASERSLIDQGSVQPGTHVSQTVDVPDGGALSLDWWESPIALYREWELSGGGELPVGIVAGGCTTPFADRWMIPGMDTSGGGQAILRFTNPFSTDATIELGFVSPEGPVQPLALRNLSVGARDVLEIDVNEFLPERSDLAAVVSVVAGRIGAEGYQFFRPAIGGVNGVSLLAGATEPAERWTVPWIVDGTDLASWLWVYNPSQREALVELTYHLDDGGIFPQKIDEVLVAPGTVQRVDLRGTMPQGVSVAALSAVSEGAPVVVSAAQELRADDAQRTGLAVQLGAPRMDDVWLVSGSAAENRAEQLRVVNPGSSPARFSVTALGADPVGPSDDLADLAVGPGASSVIDLGPVIPDSGTWTVLVTATQGAVVVGRVGSDLDGPRRLVASAGIPSSAWMTMDPGTRTRYDQGMMTRYDTALGIERMDPLLAPAQPLPGVGELGSPQDGLAPPAGDDLLELDGVDDLPAEDDPAAENDPAADEPPPPGEEADQNADDSDSDPDSASDDQGDGSGGDDGADSPVSDSIDDVLFGDREASIGVSGNP